MHQEVQRNGNYSAPVRTLSIRGPFRKSTLNGGLKRRFNPNLRQYGHAGLDSTRRTQDGRKRPILGPRPDLCPHLPTKNVESNIQKS